MLSPCAHPVTPISVSGEPLSLIVQTSELPLSPTVPIGGQSCAFANADVKQHNNEKMKILLRNDRVILWMRFFNQKFSPV